MEGSRKTKTLHKNKWESCQLHRFKKKKKRRVFHRSVPCFMLESPMMQMKTSKAPVSTGWRFLAEGAVTVSDYPTVPQERAFVYISGRQLYCIIDDPCDGDSDLLYPKYSVDDVHCLPDCHFHPSHTHSRCLILAPAVTNQYKRVPVFKTSQIGEEWIWSTVSPMSVGKFEELMSWSQTATLSCGSYWYLQ